MSSIHDYAALDAAIIKRITQAQPALFCYITQSNVSADNVMRLAEGLADHPSENAEAWRIVDRRLQAMRRAGKIKYQRKPEGWVLA